MIVKNEAAIIERCLLSLRDQIDYWVIVDTGSTDNTKELIQSILKDIPGELYERPWVCFGRNRTEALRLAEGKSDYLLFCDADMELRVNDSDWKEHLSEDAYYVKQSLGDFSYQNLRLLRSDVSRDWQYWGSTHEFLGKEGQHNESPLLTDIEFIDHASGSSRPNKFKRDIELLNAEIEGFGSERTDWKELLYKRAVFYLAQSYLDDGNLPKAQETYSKRISLGGWPEEIWYSYLQIARIEQLIDFPEAETIADYLRAYEYRPQRIESLVDLAKFLRDKGKFSLAKVFACHAASQKRPDDRLFMQGDYYTWRAKEELALACYYTGEYSKSAEIFREILSVDSLREEDRTRTLNNLRFCEEKL